MTRHNASWAGALACGLLLALAGCGGSGTAASGKTQNATLLAPQLEGMVEQVDKMGIVEWHGQLLTKNPDKGGKRLLDLSGRYSPSTGYSELSLDSTIDGNAQQVDYLVVAGRSYFNSEVWGPGAADCWADITDDAARTWALPTDLNPTWALTAARPVELDGEDVAVRLPLEEVLGGLPRGLFPTVPTIPQNTEAKAVIAPHGHLVEVGVDLMSLWNDLSKEQRAAFDTRRAGWWAMTMKESLNGASIVPPQHVFDPAVTPPTQCTRV